MNFWQQQWLQHPKNTSALEMEQTRAELKEDFIADNVFEAMIKCWRLNELKRGKKSQEISSDDKDEVTLDNRD